MLLAVAAGSSLVLPAPRRVRCDLTTRQLLQRGIHVDAAKEKHCEAESKGRIADAQALLAAEEEGNAFI